MKTVTNDRITIIGAVFVAALLFSCGNNLLSLPPTLNPPMPDIATGPTVTPTYSSLTIAWTSLVNVTSSIEWGTSSGTYPYMTPKTSSPATSHSITINGLTQGQTIYYRIHMFWDGRANYRSNEFTATTNAENPPDYVRARGIWMVGGLSGSAINTTVGTIDLYDPVTNTWYPDVAASATGTYVPVSFAGYAAYNGKIYVIGGFDSTGACMNLVQIYDTNANSWSTGANNIPAARANVNAAVYGGRIYILGGTTGAASAAFAAQNSTYVYNIAGDNWTTSLALGASANRSTLVYGGVVYHFGGKSAATTYLSTHDGYTIADNLVTSGQTEVALSTVRAGMAAVLYAKSGVTPAIILIGGVSASTGTTGNFINQSTTGATLLNIVQYLRYPFVAPSAWLAITSGREYPTNIAFSAAVIVSVSGTPYIYVFGGTQALGSSASGQKSVYRVTTPPEPPTTWDPSPSWASQANMPTGRWGHGAVTFASQE
mgnify:CR=1 FL=1